MSRNHTTVSAILLATASLWPQQATSQAAITGRVLADSGRVPVARAEVRIPAISRRVVAGDSGQFKLSDLPPGDHLLVTTAVGFTPDTSIIELERDLVIVKDITLRPSATLLGTVDVNATGSPPTGAKLAGFEHRRAQGVGRFMDRSALAKLEDRRTGDVFNSFPGVEVLRGGGSSAFASSSRHAPPLRVRTGPRTQCLMDVYLDGVNVYSAGLQRGVPFDLNSIPVASIDAIEVYTSAAQIPAQFNKTSGGCGVIVIWTK